MRRLNDAGMGIETDVFSGKTDDREIIINRLLDAPRELVYEVWTW
jgi:hypothetical protein